MNPSILTMLVTVGGAIIMVLVGVVYLISRIRQNDMTILRDANEDLRKSLVDLQNKVSILTTKVIDLEHRNKTLEDLVLVALKQYFFENPKVASQIKEVVTASNS